MPDIFRYSTANRRPIPTTLLCSDVISPSKCGDDSPSIKIFAIFDGETMSQCEKFVFISKIEGDSPSKCDVFSLFSILLGNAMAIRRRNKEFSHWVLMSLLVRNANAGRCCITSHSCSLMRKILQKHGLLLNTWDRYPVPKLLFKSYDYNSKCARKTKNCELHSSC